MKSRDALHMGDYNFFGELLNQHWQVKKKYAPHATSPYINKCYEVALKSGALGGKIMGAGGGGGFFIFYHQGNLKERLGFVYEMEQVDLKYLPFKFDMEGVKTIGEG